MVDADPPKDWGRLSLTAAVEVALRETPDRTLSVAEIGARLTTHPDYIRSTIHKRLIYLERQRRIVRVFYGHYRAVSRVYEQRT